MHLQETTLTSETVYQGRILRITKDTAQLENGSTALREVVHHGGGVGVVPLTDTGEVILVRQFRYPHHCATLEIPAGKLEAEESTLTCGTRELLEEAGATADSMESLGCLLATPAYDTEVIHLYLARGLHFTRQKLDEDEFLDVVRMPLRQAVELVLRDEIRDSKTQIALMKAWLLTQDGQK